MLLLSPLPRVLPPFVLLVSSPQCHFILLEHCWSVFTLFYFCGAVFFHVLFIFKHSPAWGSWRKRSFILIEIPLLSLSSVLLQSIKGASLFLQSNVILNTAIRAFRENYIRKHSHYHPSPPRVQLLIPSLGRCCLPSARSPRRRSATNVGLPPNLRPSLAPAQPCCCAPIPGVKGLSCGSSWEEEMRGGSGGFGINGP